MLPPTSFIRLWVVSYWYVMLLFVTGVFVAALYKLVIWVAKVGNSPWVTVASIDVLKLVEFEPISLLALSPSI